MSGTKVGGWRYPITRSDWPGLLAWYVDGPPAGRASATTEIVRSVVASPAREQLCFVTSMWALVVTPAPGSPGPVDAVRVDTTEQGDVLVEHLPLVGLADKIQRPDVEAVPLFWRFMKEKYGIEGLP